MSPKQVQVRLCEMSKKQGIVPGRGGGWATRMGGVACELSLGGRMRPGHVGDEGSKDSRWRELQPKLLGGDENIGE